MHPSAPLAPEVFARHAAALRSLARALVREPADAEDVVQETWVAYLQSPPSRLESLGGWLSTVLRRRASNRRRESGRRALHEQAARRPESFDPRGIEQQEQTLHAVVAAVSALDDQLKQVVMLRYFEGLTPGQVAERLGVAPNVVYDRLHRAHAKLRTRLEGEFGSARALALALAAFSGDEVGAVKHAVAQTAAASQAPWLASPLALGAAAALSLAAIAVALHREARRDERSGREGVAAGSSTSLSEQVASAESGLDGPSAMRAAVDVQGSGERTGSGASARAIPTPTFEFELELTLLDHLDRSDASTAVFAAPAGGTLNLVGSTDVDGRFTLRTRAWSARTELDVALGADSVVRRVALTGGKQSLVLRTPPLPRITRKGEPPVDPTERTVVASNANVLNSRLQRTPHASYDASRHVTFFEPLMEFGAREAAQDPVAPPDDMSEIFEENFVAISDYTVQEDGSDKEAPAPRCRVAGVVLDSDGAARAGVVVSLRRTDEGGWTSWSSDERGLFEFKDLAPGEYVVRASGDELGAAHGRLTLSAGQRVNWDARLERGDVFEGELVDASGRPLRDWSVEVEGARGADLARTDENGRFVLANAPSGALRVLARPIVLPAVPPLVLADGVHAADGARKFTLEFAGQKPLGELRLVVPELVAEDNLDRASSGASESTREPRREFEVRAWRVDSQRGASPLLSDATDNPRSLRAMLLPGEYRVEVLLAGREPRVIAPVFVTAGEVHDLSIPLAPGARVEFLSDASSEPMHAVLLRRGDSFDALISLPSTNATIAELRPGAYSAWNAMSGRWLADFEAQAGATLQVQLAPTTH
jgi:RNA polymerase sigma-70 factor (ECF subfamily)